MTTRHPYLIINGEAEMEWIMGENAATKGVQQITPFFKGDVGLDTGEVVVDFVRYNRNYFAFYTSMGKTYEYGDANLLEIALPSELTPCYHAGWYIGYGESRLVFVNRKKPDVYLSYFTTRTVNAMFRLPYTDVLLVDDGTNWSRYKLEIDENNGDGHPIDLSRKKTICDTGLLRMDSDGCVVAVAHSGGKITIVWTTSWKTHHTLRAPDMCEMAVSKKCLVGITADRNHVYYWDLASGDVELVLSSSWHRPSYIAFHEDIPGLGITTIDKDSKTLAVWEMNGPTPRWTEWEPFKISNRVHLVAVVPYDWEVSAVAFWSNKILLNADGLMLKLGMNLNGRHFTWPKQLVKWIDDPSEDLYLEPLIELDGSLPTIIQDACILNMPHIVVKILENVMTGQKSCRWSLHKILKNEGIEQAFILALEFSIVKMYTDELFKDREMCTQLAVWCRTMDLNIENLFEILPLPCTTSDFIFYLTMVSTLTTRFEKNIANRPGLLEKTWEFFKKGSMTARQLLYKLHMYITNWTDYLEDTRCFEFILPPVVYHSCKAGYTNEWIALFQKIERSKPNRNVKACWDELVRYVCNRDILRTHEYPNPNDGKWVKKEMTEIPMHSWILIDDVVQQLKISDDNELTGEVQCWIPNEKGANAIERALTLMDIELWQHKPEWRVADDITIRDLCTGTELRLSTGVGNLIEWPILVMESGVICSIKPEQKVEYRLPSLDLSVPLSVVMEVEEYMKKEIVTGNLPPIPARFKPVVFDMLSPTPIKSITPINIDDDKEGTPVTSVCCAGRYNVWFGTFNGHIIIIPTDSLAKQPSDRKTIVMFDTFDDAITGLTYSAMKVAGVSAAGHIKIWDCQTYKCTVGLEDQDARAARFVGIDTLWYLSPQGLYSWNFVLDTEPILVWTCPNRAPALTHYSLASYEHYAACTSGRLTHWFTPYPQSLSHKAHTIGPAVLCMISEQDFLWGDHSGKVKIVSSEEGEFEDVVWEHEHGISITALYNIEDSVKYVCAIGCEDGTFVLQPLSEAVDTYPPLFEWKANEAVIHIAYSKPRLIIVTADYCVYVLVYADQQVTLASKAIVHLAKQPDWKAFLQRPEHSPKIQEIVEAGAIRGRQLDHFWKVFDVVTDNEDALRLWCVPNMLSTLDICKKKSTVPEPYNKVAQRLFCYSGKKFTCMLCLGSSSSPKRFPISALKTCMHRFHTKCINEHISKTREWDDECQQNWALRVTLKCPICREPYNRSDVVDDKFTADLCKYISDDEESEL